MPNRASLIVVCSWLTLAGISGAGRSAWAQPPIPVAPLKYNGIIASQEAYARGEAERQQAIGQQIATNEAMAWYAGFPGFIPRPPDLAAIYAHYPPRAYRWPRPPRAYAFRGYPPVFAPWPMVPGDIWGFPYPNRVPQPSGHVVVPSGPNGYSYWPYYGPAPWFPQPAPTEQVVPPQPQGELTPTPEPQMNAVPAPPAAEAIPAPQPEAQGPQAF